MLLHISNGMCQSNISSTGELDTNIITIDSVLISIEEIRNANAKFVELEYQKQINEHLIDVIQNDSAFIDELYFDMGLIEYNKDKEIKKIKTERNILGGTTAIAVILLIISIL